MDEPRRQPGTGASPGHPGHGASPAPGPAPGRAPDPGTAAGPTREPVAREPVAREPVAREPVAREPVAREPEVGCGSDEDFDEWTAWLDREVAAGRDPVPAERAAGQGISVSLGDAGGVDPELLAAICGADGAGPGRQFGQDAAADVLPPGPVLAALTEAAVADVTRLSDDQLIGVLQAARRQENREAWKKALVIAEFARRRQAGFDAAVARGVPVHCRPGQFPGEELAAELLLGPVAASHAIDDAGDLVSRLPRTLAGMAAGLIDESRAGVIAMYTRSLDMDDAALADEILAALAPALRLDQLMRKAAALEMKLAPEAVRARREHAKQTRQRVEVRREESGNASVAGREMDTGRALAAKAYMHALALRLRRAGLPGTLDQLRLAVFEDLTSGRDPMDRLTPQAVGPTGAGPSGAGRPSGPGPSTASAPEPDLTTPGPPEGDAAPAGPTARGAGATSGSADSARDGQEALPDKAQAAAAGHGIPPDGGPQPECGPPPDDDGGDGGGAAADGEIQPGSLDYDHDEDDGDCRPDDPAPGPRPPVPVPAVINPVPVPAVINPVPVPAMINLVVHAGTLFGWDTTPTEVGGWGLLDADETRALVAAASRHPATRWCLTLLGSDGTAAAHGCSPGQHPWAPEDQHDKPSGRRSPAPSGRRSPDPAQAERLAGFLRGLNVIPEPIATGNCDHAAAEPRYTPSRKLAHLVRARTATCDAPGCTAQAVHADLDHTVAYPDGPTNQCNLGPRCRRHHKCKQTPGWKVEQVEPGVIRWTLPSGRTHTTRPTSYLLKPK